MMQARGGRAFVGRPVLIAALCAGIALLALREQATRASSEHPLSRLGGWFAGHPAILDQRILDNSAAAALAGKLLSADDRAAVRALQVARPMAITPFLVAGADAQMGGAVGDAERRYRAAQLRDPRAPAPRLLLADLYLRSGRVREGLGEMLGVARVAPTTAPPIGPALAAYARVPGALANLKPALSADPALRDQVLGLLAADPANARLVLDLAVPRAAGAGPRPWEGAFLTGLVTAGKAPDAREIWGRWNGLSNLSASIINPSFAPIPASPPFNWEALSGPAGLAEFKADGGLGIVYYGRDPAMLARQLLVLTPGKYRLTTASMGPDDLASLRWIMRCASGNILGTIPMTVGGEVSVPADCNAQWLELHAVPPDMEATVEGTLTSVRLERMP